MSMHLRGSSDMMRNEDEGWWTSRTGLEQKLIILSTILFIVTFSLTITVIVYKNRLDKADCPTVAPPTTVTTVTPETSDTTAVTGDVTSNTDSTVNPTTEGASTPSPESSSAAPTTMPSPETTPSKETPAPVPVTTPKVEEPTKKDQKENVAPFVALIREERRVQDEYEKHKLMGA